MARLEDITIQLMKRNARKRGPTSSDNLNDMIDEISSDLTGISSQWTSSLLPLLLTVSDGTEGTANFVDAFTDGLDGKTLFVDATSSTTVNPTYYRSADSRPYTVFEQMELIYSSITTLEETLSDQITNLTQSAAQISVQDSGGLLSANNVEDALAEIKTSLDSVTSIDADAIHDNVSGEIAAVTVKSTPINADLLLLEDSAASNVKRKVTVGTVRGLADYISVTLTTANTAPGPAGLFTPLDTTTNGGATTTGADSGTISFSSSTGEFTLPVTGAYELTIVSIAESTGGDIFTAFQFTKNVSTVVWTGRPHLNASTDPHFFTAIVALNFIATDTIRFELDSFAGSTMEVHAGTTMTIKRIS